jgi:hypothetical protein
MVRFFIEPLRMMLDAVKYGFWALAVILQIAACALMIKRGLKREYVAFFAYLAFRILRELLLFAIFRFDHGAFAYKTYFYSYWSTEAVCAVLALLVIFSISKIFFRDYRRLHKIVSVLLLFALLALLAFDIFLNARAPGQETRRVVSSILLLSRSVDVIEVGLICGILLFSHILSLPVRNHLAFGISLGLSVLAIADLLATSLRVEFGRVVNLVYAFMLQSAYLLAVLVWLVYIRAPREQIVVEGEQASDDVANWNDVLRDLLQP